MKTPLPYCWINLLILLVLFAHTIQAQVELPQVSPRSTVSQKIGLTEVSINYGRPSTKGRKTFGELEPYNQLWRTGANESTIISFADEVTIQGNKLPAGKYALFTIPGKNEWIIILNKNTKLWGKDGYNQQMDALRFSVKPTEIPMQETMVFEFTNTQIDAADIALKWEKTQVAFKVKTNSQQKAMANIEKAIVAEPNNWVIYTEAAGYCVQSNTNLKQGMIWINKSIDLQAHWWNHWTKAQLLAAAGDTKQAVSFAEKAVALGKTDVDFKNYQRMIEQSIAGWKAKVKS
jgi:tetratricopeptide (TPR) repeat protein